jgi:small redox-active disulfide protein 2
MNNVKVLGSGCAKCKALEEKVKRLVSENSLDYQVEKITEISEIMKFRILSTPGLVVNGVVKSSGTMPTDDQIISWLKGDTK